MGLTKETRKLRPPALSSVAAAMAHQGLGFDPGPVIFGIEDGFAFDRSGEL
jgi:hypothetical protein